MAESLLSYRQTKQWSELIIIKFISGYLLATIFERLPTGTLHFWSLHPSCNAKYLCFFFLAIIMNRIADRSPVSLFSNNQDGNTMHKAFYTFMHSQKKEVGCKDYMFKDEIYIEIH